MFYGNKKLGRFVKTSVTFGSLLYLTTNEEM